MSTNKFDEGRELFIIKYTTKCSYLSEERRTSTRSRSDVQRVNELGKKLVIQEINTVIYYYTKYFHETNNISTFLQTHDPSCSCLSDQDCKMSSVAVLLSKHVSL